MYHLIRNPKFPNLTFLLVLVMKLVIRSILSKVRLIKLDPDERACSALHLKHAVCKKRVRTFFDANIQRTKSEPVFMACTIHALTEKLRKNLGQFLCINDVNEGNQSYETYETGTHRACRDKHKYSNPSLCSCQKLTKSGL